MVVGQDIAVGADDEAGTGGGRLGHLAPDIGGGLVGDGHHGVHVHGVDLAGVQAALGGHGGAGDACAGLGVLQSLDLLLELGDLQVHLDLVLLQPVLPAAVDDARGGGAGADDHRCGRDGGQDPLAGLPVFGGTLFRGGVFLGLGGVGPLIHRLMFRDRLGLGFGLHPGVAGGGREEFLLARAGAVPGGVLRLRGGSFVNGFLADGQVLLGGVKVQFIVVFHGGSSLFSLVALCIHHRPNM